MRRAAAALAAGAASGLAIQWLANVAVAMWTGGEEGLDGPFYPALAVIAAGVGALVAPLGERVFLRAMPLRAVVDAWPRLFLVTFAAALPALAFWPLIAWATNPAAFFAACAWERHRFERRLEAGRAVR